MNRILLGNIVAFVGALMMVAIGLIKKKKGILLAQCVQNVVFSCSNFILGGYTGVISNGVSIARNLVCYKWRFTLGWKLLFIALQVAISLVIGAEGFVAWLPIVANCLYTWYLDTDNKIFLKGVIIVTLVMWATFDICMKNYVTAAMDVFSIFSNLVGIRMILADRKK